MQRVVSSNNMGTFNVNSQCKRHIAHGDRHIHLATVTLCYFHLVVQNLSP